ncbi:MAG: CRISPR-associated endonuclease Cas3'' [Rhodospirillales bacterium]
MAVLRRKDLIELFNTDPDLSGFDIDISPYVRDADDTDVLVFWRTIDNEPSADASRPMREELCPVAVGRFREFLKRRAGAFVWDGLDRRWVKLDPTRLRPGLTILLDSTLGGYDPELGFSADSKATVEPVAPAVATAPPPEAIADDRRSMLRCYVGLGRHLAHAEAEAERLCAALDRGIEANGAWQAERAAVVRAARWHDVGKAHHVFQDAIVDCPDQGKMRPAGLLAKSACRMQGYERRFFRHELASALAWLAHGDAGGGVGGASDVDPDLVAYLIAAHHGKVRLGIRALPGEREPNNPRDGRWFARGIWHGDELPEVDVGGKERLPPVQLSLAPMVLGDGASGRSWAARTQRLLARHGPFRLAWLEALVRIADWRASAAEQHAGDDDV